MKKLLHVLTLVLAVNFLAVAGGVGWLFGSGKVDKTKAAAIKELIWPASQPAEAAVATQPSTQPSPTASDRLDDLLAKYAGRRAGEQVELIQQSVDSQSAALDRRTRELDNLMAQILREKEELAQKSTSLDADRKRLAEQQDKQAALASDKGFQDSLKLYASMPGKQVKAAFMAMPEDEVVRYLQAMPQRTAAKIIKEFKTPDEQDRVNRVMERMRQGNQATKPGSNDAAARGADPAGRAGGFAPDPFLPGGGGGGNSGGGGDGFSRPADARPPTE